jgi:hypothetical protein
MSKATHGIFMVTIALPEQHVAVHARDEEDACYKVWLMIGAAGVKILGTLTAEQRDEVRAA